jgi:hypothetical protein
MDRENFGSKILGFPPALEVKFDTFPFEFS